MLKVTGLSAAIQFNKKIANNAKMYNLTEQIVKDTVSLMRKYCPVDTGRMMQAIRYVKSGKGIFKIIIDIPYAIFNEFGTKYMPAGSVESPKAITSTSGKSAYRPFMRPSLWQINRMFPDYVKRILFNIRR